MSREAFFVCPTHQSVGATLPNVRLACLDLLLGIAPGAIASDKRGHYARKDGD